MKKQNWYTNPRKYHFLYKTTCTVNGKYYYGMHSTDDLDDGYIGSGTRLWHAIRKHGREKFTLEILEFCNNREMLKQRESELITEDVLKDSQCMNIALGGSGGWIWSEERKCYFRKKLARSDIKEKMKTRWTSKRRTEQASRLRSINEKRFANYWDTHKTRKERLLEHRIKIGYIPPNRSNIAKLQWEKQKKDLERFNQIKQKMSESAKKRDKRSHSEESKTKMSELKIGKSQRIVICPHCNKEGGAATMPRWHFDNCKLKVDNVR